LSLPFFGNVYLPNRTVNNVIEVGFSNLEILHFYSEGSIKFRVEKLQEYKNIREVMNHRFMEKLEKLEKINELNIDS
jgi:hypothetical protein